MATFLLASLANTLMQLPAPYGLAAIGLLAILAMTNVAQLAGSAHEPLQAGLDQFGRLIAWLFAPAIVLDAPFIRLLNIGILQEAVMGRANVTPSLLCGAFLALLAVSTFALTSADALRRLVARKRLDLSNPKPLLQTAHLPTNPSQEDDLAILLTQVQDLTRRMTLAETALLSVAQSAPVSATATNSEKSVPPPLSRPGSEISAEDDAAMEALREQGYYDGPWSEDRHEEGPDTYGPISDDADFLKIMESR